MADTPHLECGGERVSPSGFESRRGHIYPIGSPPGGAPCVKYILPNFSHALVTPAEHGGALPSGWSVPRGQGWLVLDQEGVAIDRRDERGVLERYGLGWIEPAQRRWPL